MCKWYSLNSTCRKSKKRKYVWYSFRFYSLISGKNKRYIQGLYWVFEKRNSKIHVDYYVCAYAGEEVTYLADAGGYTPYIQAAKIFDKKTAGEAAAIMTQHSRTGKHWTTQRVKVIG